MGSKNAKIDDEKKRERERGECRTFVDHPRYVLRLFVARCVTFARRGNSLLRGKRQKKKRKKKYEREREETYVQIAKDFRVCYSRWIVVRSMKSHRIDVAFLTDLLLRR